ncbi:MAG: hypothetical protein HND53_11495 [Proteobacteria bacterium]|nr:hypothetical protein [Pseudomonadota bacterium]NOG61116.1 hypothetical protein [Pseudomonadota bacterium]
MNDADDLEIDDDDDNFDELDFDSSFVKSELSSKRDVRSEIEKRLELIELRKLTGDSFYDELFD